MERKGEDMTLGKGNLKKMGRSSHGTELGDMGTRPEDPQVYKNQQGCFPSGRGLPTWSLGIHLQLSDAGRPQECEERGQ